MDEHFRAFSFVSRITSVQPGVAARGKYRVPREVADFPLSLAGEAVGQLAAWSAMAALNFERRPVAGIAALIELLELVHPGDELELEAQLESVDAEAVSYGGVASVSGVPVLRLHHCVGPMVPLADFDDPEALRERFMFLCASGTTDDGFRGVPAIVPERIAGKTGEWLRARIQIPAAAPLFADHFPRRAVFPGTLLMHTNLQLCGELAAEISAPADQSSWIIRSVHDVKLRSFTPPGELLETEVKMIETSLGAPMIAVETRNGKRVIGTARVQLSRHREAQNSGGHGSATTPIAASHNPGMA